jgi:hypothetical protein
MEGFTHPMVEKQFAKYMNMNRLQSDGQLRDSDNWQKGIPQDAYIKSLKRHYDEMWQNHRGYHEEGEAGIIAALCGIIFNAKGYLLEYLKYHDFKLQDFDGTEPTPEMKRRQDTVEPVVNELKCGQCRSVDKTWDEWPCSECTENHVDLFNKGPFNHCYFSARQDDCIE